MAHSRSAGGTANGTASRTSGGLDGPAGVHALRRLAGPRYGQEGICGGRVRDFVGRTVLLHFAAWRVRGLVGVRPVERWRGLAGEDGYRIASVHLSA